MKTKASHTKLFWLGTLALSLCSGIAVAADEPGDDMDRQRSTAEDFLRLAVRPIAIGHHGVGPNRGENPGPQVQNVAQKEDAGLHTAAPPDVVTVPDGTPLTLKLEKELSSSTAKIGDSVEFTVAYPIRFNGMVIAPRGTSVSGTVIAVSHKGLLGRNGDVRVELGKLTLPTGETVTLRLAPKSGITAKKVGEKIAQMAVPALDPFLWPVLPVFWLAKGDERVYPAGTWITAYLDGQLNLNRGALANLQPPPYKGPAQVFFRNRKDSSVKLFSGQDFVGELIPPVRRNYRLDYSALIGFARLELKPGTYSFSTSKAKEQAVQLEVHEDHQYWVEREHGGLFAGDPQQHRDEIEKLESAPWVTDRNFAAETPAYKGPAQITFVNRGIDGDLFCGQKKLVYLGGPVRIELSPGTYSFRIGKAKEEALHLEVHEDHQYWIEYSKQRTHRGLFVSDFQHLHDDMEHLPYPELMYHPSQSRRNLCVPEA